MRPAHVIEITTPKKFVLNGLWFGPAKPKKAIVIIHGMFSSAFSLHHIVGTLVSNDTAVITFNNRGFETVADVRQRVGAKRKHYRAGTAHEIFTDCIDDIQGAVNVVRKAGVKEMYLAGHSTGCQKSMYWASKTGGRGVKGIVLLAPLSDYAGDGKKPAMKNAVALARAMVKRGKKHELLPPNTWWHYASAQRLLSLYTPDSVEEIFSYSQSDKIPTTYRSVRLPILALFAGADEYSDRPAEKLVEWFARNSRSKYFRAGIVPHVGHSFRDGETRVAQLVKKWISR